VPPPGGQGPENGKDGRSEQIEAVEDSGRRRREEVEHERIGWRRKAQRDDEEWTFSINTLFTK
jgi:hypothetical protein